MEVPAENSVKAVHEPAYPLVYQVPRGTMVGYAVLAIFFLFFLIYLLINPRVYSISSCNCSLVNRVAVTTAVWFFVAAILAGLLSCIWAVYYACIGKVLLWQDALEIYRPFSYCRINRTDVAYKQFFKTGRTRQYTYLVLVSNRGKHLKILMNGWFKLDNYFQTWLNEILSK